MLRWVSSLSEGDIRVLTTGADNFRDAKVVVTSYDLLTRKVDAMQHHNFGVVIFVSQALVIIIYLDSYIYFTCHLPSVHSLGITWIGVDIPLNL